MQHNTVLSGYILGDRIGSGGFGTVHNIGDQDCEYLSGMASYHKFDDVIDNQVILD